MVKRKIYRSLLWLLSLLSILLTACGSKDQTSYVYVAEKLPVPGSKDYAGNFKSRDGYLYYVQGKGVYRLPAEKLAETENTLPAKETVFKSTGQNDICAYTLDSEGCGYYALMSTEWSTGEIQSSMLVKQQADGTTVYQLDLEGLNIADVSLAADAGGRVFLLTADSLCVVDAGGKLLAEIPGNKLGMEFNGLSSRLLEGEDGSVYYSPSDYVDVAYELSGNDDAFRQESFQRKRIKYPCTIGRCYSSQYGLLCAGKDNLLYQYQRSESRWETLLNYGDSDLQMQPYQMLQFSGDRMAAYYYDIFNKNTGHELYFLTKTDAALLPEREETELVLATSSLTSELEQFIAEYNRTSGYHITVKYYQGKERVAMLNTQMVSSSPPDLIVLEDETALTFGGKGMLEDLAPYLEASPVLNREDFLENLLAGYTINGRLISIPAAFDIKTIIGRTAQVGADVGWTREQAQGLCSSYPEAQLFLNPTFSSIVAFFTEDILERYIDWDKGECSFDGEDFHSFASWMKEHSNGFGCGHPFYLGDSWDINSKITENRLLCANGNISSFLDIMYFQLLFDNQEITAVGYPTPDGRPFHIGSGRNALAVTANSKNKEAAWKFIEAFLSRENPYYDSDLPNRRDLLAKEAEAAATLVYALTYNGEIAMYQAGEHKGEPIIKNRYFVIDEEEIPFYCLTQEQADTVMKIIEETDFTPRIGGLRYHIISILLEELGPYIESKRSLEESTRILQNRVQNLVQENISS